MDGTDELAFDGLPLGPEAEPQETAAEGSDSQETGPGPAPVRDAEEGSDAVLAQRMVHQFQRAHAAAVETHRAVSAWQIRRAAGGGPVRFTVPEAGPLLASAVPAEAPSRPVDPEPAPPAGRTDSAPDAGSLHRTLSGLKAEWSAYAAGSASPSADPGTGKEAAPDAVVTPDPHDWHRLGGPAMILRAAASALRGSAATDTGRGYETTWHSLVPTDPVPLRVRTASEGAARPAVCQVHDGDRLVLTLKEAGDQGDPAGERVAPRFLPEFRPLARTAVDRLSAAGLDALARGDFAAVFGSAFDQSRLEPPLLPEKWPERLLEDIATIAPRGGRCRQGLLTVSTGALGSPAWPALVAAVTEVLRVYAFHRGMHLCLPGAHVVPLPGATARIEVHDARALRDAALLLTVEVSAMGMMPRPYVTADCDVTTPSGQLVARVSGLGVAVYGRPEQDGMLHIEQAACRSTAAGGGALFNELHMAHAAEGDMAQFMMASGGQGSVSDVRPRLPRGDFLMIDRGAGIEHGTGKDAVGTCLTTEYDMPEEPWYARENGTGDVPTLALMEIALQPAGLLSGIALGVTLQYPDQGFVCRNLDGWGRLLSDADPRGKTVTQRTTLLSASELPGVCMHRYDFELSAGREAFYAGKAVHGYFTREVLDLQQGMDGGRLVAPWFERRPAPPAGTLRIDARGDTRLGHGRMAFLEDLAVVPGGGDHGAGYVLCSKPVRADDWYFDHHFYKDPVMPGSTGVQMLLQAVQAFALHTGLTDGRLHPVVGEELHWTYRAQMLREHRRARGEVHIRKVRRKRGRLFVHAEGSVWRDDLRIYHVENIVLATRPPATRAETAG